MKVSIITPVYNSSKYLAKCIESVFAQTYSDWEMLCVDDASTDNSLKILESYAANESRIRVFAIDQNHGQAYARNIALTHISGDIVAMLDSDDWYSTDALQKIVEIFQKHPNTDSVLFDCIYVDEKKGLWHFNNKTDKNVLTGHEACVLSLDWRIHGIYAARRHIFDTMPYDDSHHTFSDDNTTRLHYLHSREVRFSDAGYFYLQHSSSSTHQPGLQRFQMFTSLKNLAETLQHEGLSEKEMQIFREYFWRQVMGGYMLYYAWRHKMDATDKKEALRILNTTYHYVDTSNLPLSLRLRFGYAPLKWCPALYRFQMRLFTHLRLFLGMDKGRY